jgi:DNA-binding NarL/FixJ family response regulator
MSVADTLAMTHPAFTQSTPLRILVVDPDECIRESLAGLLRIGGRCAVVGTAGDPDEAVAIAAATQPDVVLLDPRFPALAGGKGIVGCLREVAPSACVLVLNGVTSIGDGPRDDGANASIKKTFRPHELIDAVIAAARTPVS